MNRHLGAFALVATLVAGCGTSRASLPSGAFLRPGDRQQPAAAPAGPPPAQAAAASGLNDVRFTGAVDKYEKHTPHAYFMASGKPLLLGARVTESYFMYMVGGKYESWRHIFLGRDGGLYVAVVESWKRHPETGLALGDEFYQVGSFEKRSRYAVGDPLKFEMAPGAALARHYENQLVKVYKHLEIRLDALPRPVKNPPLLPAADVRERSR